MGMNKDEVSRDILGGDFADGAREVLCRTEARSNSPFTTRSGSNACNHRITDGSWDAALKTRAILEMLRLSQISCGRKAEVRTRPSYGGGKEKGERDGVL